MIRKTPAIFILFLEGLASSGLQMITIRQSVPFVGSSVLSTSVVISCFLGALALGYYRGGKHQEDKYRSKLVFNLSISIGFFGIGLSYAFVTKFFGILGAISTDIPVLNNPLIHLFIFCLLIMSPLVYFLGQTVPLLLNTSAENIRKSEATGNATALSTVGNVVGCLLTSLVLMYFLGVGHAITINCLILFFCMFLINDFHTAKGKMVIGMTAVLFCITFFLNIVVSKMYFITTTAYSDFSVQNVENGRSFIINRSNASYIDSDTKDGWPYIEIIKQSILSLEKKDLNILVLGSGGFTLSADNEIDANFTYIDIDPEIKSIAETYFLKGEINGRFIAADARAFLLTTKDRWDVIVVDLYSNAATIPMHTSTNEFFSLVGSRTLSGGKVMLNIAANPYLSDDYSLNIDATIRDSLNKCVTDVSDYGDKLVNIVYLCSPKNHNRKNPTLYTDDNTKVAIDSYLLSLQNNLK